MKKIYSVLLVMCLLAGFVSAKDVEKNVAVQVAKNFYQQSSHRIISDNSLTLAYECKESSSKPVYYVYNVSDNNGFVIVSAEDMVQPILGYSNSGNYIPEKVSSSVADWLYGYEKQILYIREHNTTTTAEVTEKWSNYYNNTLPQNSNARIQTVNPLCATQWNQRPNENGMCPLDGTEHCVTGCPATAMAQIMKYWAYPAQGTGNHSYNEQHFGTLSANFGATTYDWANMPNVLTSPNNAVALLMFHCGVAVEMDYGVNGSGSFVCIETSPTVQQTCENAYKTFFGYDPTIAGKIRVHFNDADWVNMLKTELDASRPVQYAGHGNGGGHTFVCDGYDQNNLFHINWGWGGQCDGYFEINTLDPSNPGTGGGTGGYNSNQEMLIGIKPLNGGGGGGGGGTVNQDGIALHASITVNANPIESGTPLTVYTEIQNTGTADFTGDFAAALFNSDGVFLEIIQEYTNQTLQHGFYYPAQFDLTSLDVIPGLCYIGIYYKGGNNDYTIMDPLTFFNPVSIVVTGPYSDVTMSGATTITPSPTIHVSDAVTIVTHIGNAGTSGFSGWVSADIHSLDGTWLHTLDEVTANIASGSSNQLTFNASSLGVAPGNYYVAFWSSSDQANYDLVYDDNFPNPIEITVVEETILPDSYEGDNSEATAHTFTVNFAGNNADVVTTGSNIHLGDDLDYYKIVLPQGNGYTITARVDDSYHSTSGTYTDDAQFSYKIDNGAYSEPYDDVMPNSFVVANGGTVMFLASDYFPGTTGTYLLSIHIVRGPISVEEIDRTSLTLYPNPAHQKFSIDAKDLYGNYQLKIFNQLGAVVNDIAGFINHQQIVADTKELPAGFYDVLLTTDKGSFSSRLIVE